MSQDARLAARAKALRQATRTLRWDQMRLDYNYTEQWWAWVWPPREQYGDFREVLVIRLVRC